MKKLILIDDHKMLRKGISAFFTENSDWEILTEAESLDEIPQIIKIASASPDNKIVAIVDMQLKGTSETK